MSEVLIHGIVAAADRPELAEPGVRWVTHGELAALVGTVDPSGTRAANAIRLHWRVLEAAASAGTVLPVRFGTVMASDAAVVDDLLAPRQAELASLLADLAGKVQMTVKGEFDQERLMRGVVEASPSIARLRERVRGISEAAGYYDRIRLGEMVAESVERARQAYVGRVSERLEPLTVAVKVEPVSSIDGAVNAAYMVEHVRQVEFRAAVNELDHEFDGAVRMRCIGPLPPYSFADADFAQRRPTWA
jgi:Gas vesicle synthesis protein GvpL/GvpF